MVAGLPPPGGEDGHWRGIGGVAFHTNTKAVCGDFKPRDSAEYPVSYRYYGAFCVKDQAELDRNELPATPLYYGLWAFRQVPQGRFLDLDLNASALPQLRAYAVEGPRGTTTVVLINVQDPSTPTSTSDAVTVNLPSAFQGASQVVLRSTDPVGLGSLKASAISLGGQQVLPNGASTGAPTSVPVDVTHKSATITVAPGAASIFTFGHP